MQSKKHVLTVIQDLILNSTWLNLYNRVICCGVELISRSNESFIAALIEQRFNHIQTIVPQNNIIPLYDRRLIQTRSELPVSDTDQGACGYSCWEYCFTVASSTEEWISIDLSGGWGFNRLPMNDRVALLSSNSRNGMLLITTWAVNIMLSGVLNP